MRSIKGKLFVACLLCFCELLCVYAEEQSEEDNLFLSGVPVYYGEEEFVARINERTGGKREPVGLVLTGGSARALAHIGVLSYLEEQGKVPDFIVSNSMGSIIALLYSAGLSPDQILRLCTSVDISTLFDLALPFGRGLLATYGFESLVSSILGKDVKLENLKIPVMVISEDLKSKRQIRICSGDFYTVFTASYALPFYFSPVEYEEHLLTDGGIANIAPVDVAYRYTDKVIVSTTFYSGKNTNLNSPVTALNTAIDIGKRRAGMAEIMAHEDIIWIRCDVEDFSFMEFSAGAKMAEKGYESAALQSAKLKDLKTKPEGVSEFEELREKYEKKTDKVLTEWEYLHHVGFRGDAVYPSVYIDSPESSVSFGFKMGAGDVLFFPGVGFSFAADSRNPFFNWEFGIYGKLTLFSRSELSGSLIYRNLNVLRAREKYEFVLVAKPDFRLSVGERLDACFKVKAEVPEIELLSMSSRFSIKNQGLTEYPVLRVFADADLNFGKSGQFSAEIASEIQGPDIILSAGFDFSTNFAAMYGVEIKAAYSVNAKDLQKWTLDSGLKWFMRNPEANHTLAETILLSDIRLGFFAEHSISSVDLLKENMDPDLVIGVFFSADANLIGLVEFPFELKMGADFLKRGFYFAVSVL